MNEWTKVFLGLFLLLSGFLFLLMESGVYAVILAFLLASFITWLFRAWKAIEKWTGDHAEGIAKGVNHLVYCSASVAAVLFALFFRLSLIPVLVFGVMAYYAAKYAVGCWEDSRTNLTVTVLHGSGAFQNVKVNHPDGDNVWCQSYDKEGKAILLRKVTLHKDEKEGVVTVESGTKKARLVVWDGNLNSLGKRYFGYIENPGQGIPRDAELLKDVDF